MGLSYALGRVKMGGSHASRVDHGLPIPVHGNSAVLEITSSDCSPGAFSFLFRESIADPSLPSELPLLWRLA